MIKYDIYFKEYCIGKLFINEAGQYKYVANNEAINEAEKEDAIFADVKTDRDWGEPIAFFETRINNCKRFGMVERIEYPNSEYYFIKDNH